MVAMSFVVGQTQLDATNSTVLYVIGGVVVVAVAVVVWRLYVTSKTAANIRSDERRPR
jgi:hypothetical protein